MADEARRRCYAADAFTLSYFRHTTPVFSRPLFHAYHGRDASM